MSEPKLLKDIICEMAMDKDDAIGKTIVKCPFIQAELISKGLLSLDDLSDNEINNLVEHTHLNDWIDNQDVMETLHISPRTLSVLTELYLFLVSTAKSIIAVRIYRKYLPTIM